MHRAGDMLDQLSSLRKRWAREQTESSAGNRDLAITFEGTSHIRRSPQAHKIEPPVGKKCPDMSLGLGTRFLGH